MASEYPAKAMAGGHNGLVQFRLDVDPEGKVSGCHVLARTNPDDFADLTCKSLTRRGKFKPALDAQGRPVPSFFVGKVSWMMPD
jgi:TonB family protein